MMPIPLLTRAAAIGLAAAVLAGPAAAGPLGYSLTGATQYTAGCGVGDQSAGACGEPDTGWLTITNTGLSTFEGSATLAGVAPSQTLDLSISGILAPGQRWVFNAGPESSNQGGFNKQAGGLPDLGLQFSMSGTLDGAAFSRSIYDGDIHSGVVRTNPFGVALDSHVLQGGDSFGRDTFDDYEESQAAGAFVWSAPAANVPEPGSLLLAAIGAAAVLGARRRSRR